MDNLERGCQVGEVYVGQGVSPYSGINFAGIESACPSNSELQGQTENGKAKARKPYTITKQRERWTDDEHQKFLDALRMHGRAWRKIEEYIGSKTAVQIRSHAQKFFSKLERQKEAGYNTEVEDIAIPPPRPKKKPQRPYPKKESQDYSWQGDVSYNHHAASMFNVSGLATHCQYPPVAQPSEPRGGRNEVTEATVGAVAAAASAAAAAAAAAVVAAAGHQIQKYMQEHPPSGFPFFGVPPALLAQMTACAGHLPSSARVQDVWDRHQCPAPPWKSEEASENALPAGGHQDSMVEVMATNDNDMDSESLSQGCDGDSACSREEEMPRTEGHTWEEDGPGQRSSEKAYAFPKKSPANHHQHPAGALPPHHKWSHGWMPTSNIPQDMRSHPPPRPAHPPGGTTKAAVPNAPRPVNHAKVNDGSNWRSLYSTRQGNQSDQSSGSKRVTTAVEEAGLPTKQEGQEESPGYSETPGPPASPSIQEHGKAPSQPSGNTNTSGSNDLNGSSRAQTTRSSKHHKDAAKDATNNLNNGSNYGSNGHTNGSSLNGNGNSNGHGTSVKGSNTIDGTGSGDGPFKYQGLPACSTAPSYPHAGRDLGERSGSGDRSGCGADGNGEPRVKNERSGVDQPNNGASGINIAGDAASSDLEDGSLLPSAFHHEPGGQLPSPDNGALEAVVAALQAQANFVNPLILQQAYATAAATAQSLVPQGVRSNPNLANQFTSQITNHLTTHLANQLTTAALTNRLAGALQNLTGSYHHPFVPSSSSLLGGGPSSHLPLSSRTLANPCAGNGVQNTYGEMHNGYGVNVGALLTNYTLVGNPTQPPFSTNSLSSYQTSPRDNVAANLLSQVLEARLSSPEALDMARVQSQGVQSDSRSAGVKRPLPLPLPRSSEAPNCKRRSL